MGIRSSNVPRSSKYMVHGGSVAALTGAGAPDTLAPHMRAAAGSSSVLRMYIASACKIKNLRAINQSTLSSSTFTLTIQKDDVDTALSVSWDAVGANTVRTDTDEVACAAGTWLTVTVTRSAGAQGTVFDWSFEVVPD